MSSSNPISTSSSSSSSGNVSMPSPFTQSLLSPEEARAFFQEQQAVSMLSSPTSTPLASSSSSLPKEESTDAESSDEEGFKYIAGSRGITDTSIKATDKALASKENRKALDKHYKEGEKVRKDTSAAVKSVEKSRSKNPKFALTASDAAFFNALDVKKQTFVAGSEIENKQRLKITDTDSSASQRRPNSPQG